MNHILMINHECFLFDNCWVNFTRLNAMWTISFIGLFKRKAIIMSTLIRKKRLMLPKSFQNCVTIKNQYIFNSSVNASIK